jgi:hypothetical protein
MFSTTTIASSITRPIAIARPPSDIRLTVPPTSCSTKKVPTSVSGSETAAIAVTRQSRRKATSTSTASSPPIRIASRTLATALRTNSARS